MKDWWDNLEAREQMFVMAGGLFVIIAVLYALVWSPFDRSHQQLANSVNNWERSLAELRPLKGVIGSARDTTQGNARLSNQPPIIIVDQTLPPDDEMAMGSMSMAVAGGGTGRGGKVRVRGDGGQPRLVVLA